MDLAELVRTPLGQPEELLYIEGQAEAAASPAPPLRAPQLPALVERLVAGLIQAAGADVPVGGGRKAPAPPAPPLRAPQLPALVERLVAGLIQAAGPELPVGARLTSNRS